MRSSYVLAPLTIVLGITTVVSVAAHMLSKPPATSTEDSESDSSILDGSLTGATAVELSQAGLEKLLMTGVSATPPDPRTIPILQEIPWQSREVGRVYRQSGPGMACVLLEPGIELVQQMASPTPGRAGVLGRQSVFTISLQVDPAATATLPRVTRTAIESYLISHQLTIQAVLYHNEAGEAFFGPQVRAAFVDVQTPEKTIIPEQMIGAAVGQLRTLGMLWEKETELIPAQSRTLVLAFSYNLSDSLSSDSRATGKQEFELLFLHMLKDSTAAQPKFIAFATSDARTEFNLLEETNPNTARLNSTIAARVRFNSFEMMGMYPSKPVVTGMFHESRLSLPVDSLIALQETIGTEQKKSFSEILDELYERMLEETGKKPATRTQPPVKSPSPSSPANAQSASATASSPSAGATTPPSDSAAKTESQPLPTGTPPSTNPAKK